MIVLIQCVSKKNDEPAKAKRLYNSRLFHAQVRYATSVGDSWYILSAKHGLLEPDTVIEPYDKRMSDVENATEWAESVVESLGDIDETVKIAAGSDYADPIVPLLESNGVEVHEPFRGQRLWDRTEMMIEKAREEQNRSLDYYEV